MGKECVSYPIVIKIYWQNGYIRVVTKALKDLSASDTEILHTDAWKDGESHTFSERVDFEKFTIEIKASDGKLEVIFNESVSKTFEDIHIARWGVFENYFKAGNYLQSRDEGAFAKVKFYKLEVTH